MKKQNYHLEILNELSQAEAFKVKAPINSPEFWSEWQDKYSKAFFFKMATKKVLMQKRLTPEAILELKSKLLFYEDILFYLDQLKISALNLKGFFPSSSYPFEFDDEDRDSDI